MLKIVLNIFRVISLIKKVFFKMIREPCYLSDVHEINFCFDILYPMSYTELALNVPHIAISIENMFCT